MPERWAMITSIGRRDENQDVVISEETNDYLKLAVFDGHGSRGKLVAERVGELMKRKIESNYEDSIKELFLDTQETLISMSKDPNEKFDATFSGTTGTMMLVRDQDIIMANVGDSEAIMTLDDGTYKLLTIRHDLDVPEEKQRIEDSGGLVERIRKSDGTLEDGGPLRIWLKENRVPGLMMTRSLGDIACHGVGVLAEPTISKFDKNGSCVIVASDGLWDFVKFQEATEFIKNFSNAEEAADGLMKMSYARQRSGHADNISVIVYFLDTPEERQARINSSAESLAAVKKCKQEIAAYQETIKNHKSRDFERRLQKSESKAQSEHHSEVCVIL